MYRARARDRRVRNEDTHHSQRHMPRHDARAPSTPGQHASLPVDARRFLRCCAILALVMSLACDSVIGTDNHTLRIRGPGEVSVPIGGTTQLFAIAVDDRSRETVVKAGWQSSDPDVLGISQGGVLVAHSYGVAEVTARADGRIARVQVRTRPAGLALRLAVGGASVEVGEDYRVVAEFVDVKGDAVRVPLELRWSATGASVLAARGEPGHHSATLRAVRGGPSTVNVVAPDGATAHLSLTALADADPVAEVQEQSLLRYSDGMGRAHYAPDIVLLARLPVTVTRLEFVGHVLVCAAVPLSPGMPTPLFDFQPYDWGFTAPFLRDGEEMEVAMTMTLPSGRVRVQRARVVVTSANGVLDRGATTYAWEDC